MIVKSYKNGETELVITINKDQTYNVVRSVKDNTSNFQNGLDLESALDTFEYWQEMEISK